MKCSDVVNKTKIGLDLGEMDVWMVHVDARGRVISMIEAHGFYGKLPKSVKDQSSSHILLSHIVLPHVLSGQNLAN